MIALQFALFFASISAAMTAAAVLAHLAAVPTRLRLDPGGAAVRRAREIRPTAGAGRGGQEIRLTRPALPGRPDTFTRPTSNTSAPQALPRFHTEHETSRAPKRGPPQPRLGQTTEN